MTSPRPMTEAEYQRHYQLVRRLPVQLERARLRVRHLEMQAERLGMAELLDPARQA